METSQSDSSPQLPWYQRIPQPNVFVLIFFLIVLMALLSWLIPAGQYERIVVDGRERIKPDSFQLVARQGQGIFAILKSIPLGFARGQAVSFFIFATGGAFYLLNKTRSIEAVLATIVVKLKGKERLVIPIVLLVMGIAGATIGMAEETIVFITLSVTLARAMGYDSLIGVAMISLGAGLGFTSGVMNPFTVGVAQSIAQVKTFSGVGLRSLLFIVMWIVTSTYVLLYAKKIKASPESSIVYEEELMAKKSSSDSLESKTEDIRMTSQQKLIILVFVLSFALIAYGVLKLDWFITEIGAVFIGMSFIAALIDKMSFNEIADGFVKGASELLPGALVVGLAQSMVVVMEDGMIMDTIIHYLTQMISFLPSTLAAVGMYVVQIIINFFINSGSGQAAVVMPIMVPLSDNLEITRQTAVLAFQLGDGFLDSIMPMSAVLMSQLAIAKISYKKWVKFVGPLMLIWLLIGTIFVLYAHLTHWTGL